MLRNNTRRIALGGMLAAVAVVIMCLGGLIPVATYACPMLCCATAYLVLAFCGKRIAWAWYAAVSILTLLMGPDKEAAIIFLFLGYYPLIKAAIDRCKFSAMIKFLFFNLSVLVAYWLMIHLMGMAYIAQENAEFGAWGILLLLAMGNVVFYLLDRLLCKIAGKIR